jgi:hypothetical protein
MFRLKEVFSRYAVAVILVAVCGSWHTAAAVEDQLMVQIDRNGELMAGTGTGYDRGAWYYYPFTDWWNQWFYNDAPVRDQRKVITVDLSIQPLNPITSGYVEVAVNWTTLDWPADWGAPPLPEDLQSEDEENRYIQRRAIIARTEVRGTLTSNSSVEVETYCPQWVSLDIRGENIRVDGRVRHECLSGDTPVPPTGVRDFGDAPEGALAYPPSMVKGLFPTCVTVGPASWIEHDSKSMYFGLKVDVEDDGNGGKCPAFNPDQYNQDEGQRDGDAGLIRTRAFTIKGPLGSEEILPLNTLVLEFLPNACLSASWGTDIDTEVHNKSPDGREAYVNVLFDWNHDGKWQGFSQCSDGRAPEHVLVNFPVPNGYNGPLSALRLPMFKMGPLGGYVWARFTISERKVTEPWSGDGVFLDGETEDYLLVAKEPLKFCDWHQGDPHKMHWPQLPDKQTTGVDVDMFWSSLADDFQCTGNGPIKEIHFWASFLDDVLPMYSVDGLRFQISIYSNKPADNQVQWSRPDQLLWTREIEPYSYDVHDLSGLIHQGWFDPASQEYLPENHERLWQYDICFDDDDPNLFVQRRGGIYWLEIKEKRAPDAIHMFGWRTTQQRLQYNDKAVWRHPVLGWRPMVYPVGHDYEGRPLDLAFVITGTAVADTDYGDAPDPTYPTLSISDGASHTVDSRVYLGSTVDAEFDGQPNDTATGDDANGVHDEDGVVFGLLLAGDTADVTVTASTQGVLNAWIDWNADGDWADAGEHVFADRLLSSGVNTLTLAVPQNAAMGDTFARFRFSTQRGLSYDGAAPDGEVEDYMVRIEEAVPPPEPPIEHLKWSQPAIEKNPQSQMPVYCGWDEPAYANKPVWFDPTQWKLVADDFRCIGDMPVTSVHWWGSYEGWDGGEAPRTQPASWRIAFWSNVLADTRYPFSRPGDLLWLINVPADRVQEKRVGVDEFPRKPSDTTFQYQLQLDPHEYFQQVDFVSTSTKDQVFWISITAVYASSPGPEFPWGWKTRPQSWMDAAVKAELRRDDLRTGITLDPASAQPIAESLTCQRLDKYDMAFELDTSPEFIKWEQAFTGLRQWPHYEDEQSMAIEGPGAVRKWNQEPDLTTAGIDVDATVDIPPTWPETICGDDFECKTTGPITRITIWGSWYNDILPSGSAANVEFTLSIREDIPAARGPTRYSTPGKVLWTKKFVRGQFSVDPQQGPREGYYSPANETYEQSNHSKVYKYTFTIDSSEAFRQTGTAIRPVVYWLTVQALVVDSPGSVATRFGWKSSAEHWNDDAVWGEGEEPWQGTWHELRYPRAHPAAQRSVDLAFTIETQAAGSGLTLRRVVADDWRCTSTRPVTGIVWWGSYIGYGYLPCDCTQAAAPRKPDYFSLSIWTNVLDSAHGYSPGQKVWEYKAEQFDEVMVGFDKHPEPTSSSMRGFEPVYRYSVRLPEDRWFRQEGRNNVYWLSVVAVYRDEKTIVYPWGWTNHPHVGWDVQGLDMLGYWKLDETAGTIAADSSGNANHGTVFGSAVWRPAGGWLAGALDFDGRNDYIKVEKPKGFNFAPNSFSISAWIYPRETRGKWHAIMEYNREALNGNRFGLWLDVEGRLHFRVGQNTWQSPDSLVANQWYHVAATFNSASHAMILYIDGEPVATATYQKGFTTPTQSTLIIGARGSVDDEFFYGLLDDVRVVRGALTADDILTLAGAGANSDAMAVSFEKPVTGAWPWVELFDQTRNSEDMSFMLFTRPLLLTEQPGGQDVIVLQPGQKK